MPSYGFFREIGYRPNGPSLYAAVSAEPHPEEERILDYLRSGRVEMARFGVELDVLDPEAGKVEGDVDVVESPDGRRWAVREEVSLESLLDLSGKRDWRPYDPESMVEKRVKGIAGTGSILTDGEWRWPDTLSHYVQRYHVRLPEDLIEHMRKQRWVVPPSISAV